VTESIYYVDGGNAAPAAPYTNWATAAVSIQDAADVAAETSGSMVWVTNGVYNTGGGLIPGYASSNRVVIVGDTFVRSINGPDATFIVGEEATGGGIGSNAVRGVYMKAGVLSGFTVTNGHTQLTGDHFDTSGGGVNLCGGDGIAINCILMGNSARWGGGGSFEGRLTNCTISDNTSEQYGGGATGSFLDNCILTGNSADGYGGGITHGKLTNCTVVGNSAPNSGGCFWTPFHNSIIYDNTATDSGNNWYFFSDTNVSYSCTTPHPGGIGNITNAPLFIGGGNYRLTANSPCINAGSNGYVSVATDIEGKPRIIDGVVDMGAYESFFVTDSYPSASGVALEWMTPATGWNSVVKYSTNLVEMPFTDLSATLPYPVNSYTDTVHGTADECFYRVDISP